MRRALVAVNVGTRRSEFTYDGEQRRVRLVERDNGVVQSDTNVIWCKTGICEERATDGTTVTRRAFTLGEQVAGVPRFFAADHLGSIGEVTDSSSTLLARYAYDPWGRRSLTTGTDVSTVGFAKAEVGTVASLALTMYRGYDPDLARWLSEDPLGLAPGPNRYAYVENRPIVWRDPLGLSPLNSPWYGNFCGPGSNPGNPVDGVDGACQRHDACYDRLGASGFSGALGGWGSTSYPCELNKCDEIICEELYGAKSRSFEGAIFQMAAMTFYCNNKRRPPVPVWSYHQF
jgi:RHS repeat-associated protein